ncbi:MAG: hypothetical protein JO001_03450 [Alphaproteobacteria bacterium]|nr:hypothetical protein [Alphaproteobacteria bacterium]
MRPFIAAVAALLLGTSAVIAQTMSSPSTKMPAGEYTTEADAKAKCSASVVWLNTKSHVYHFAGTRDYGHTKNGAYMCQPDADKIGRAAKNEKPPAK